MSDDLIATLREIWPLVLVGLFLLLLLWRIHSDKDSPYDMLDLLLDAQSNKASLDKHMLIAFALLSTWVVVNRQLEGKDVETLLLGVLGVFVVRGIFPQRGADAAKPPEVSNGNP